MGFGVGVLGFGVWAPIPNPQSPIPNPQSPFLIISLILNIEKIISVNLKKYKYN